MSGRAGGRQAKQRWADYSSSDASEDPQGDDEEAINMFCRALRPVMCAGTVVGDPPEEVLVGQPAASDDKLWWKVVRLAGQRPERETSPTPVVDGGSEQPAVGLTERVAGRARPPPMPPEVEALTKSAKKKLKKQQRRLQEVGPVAPQAVPVGPKFDVEIGGKVDGADVAAGHGDGAAAALPSPVAEVVQVSLEASPQAVVHVSVELPEVPLNSCGGQDKDPPGRQDKDPPSSAELGGGKLKKPKKVKVVAEANLKEKDLREKKVQGLAEANLKEEDLREKDIREKDLLMALADMLVKRAALELLQKEREAMAEEGEALKARLASALEAVARAEAAARAFGPAG